MLIKVMTVIERLAETKEPISHGGWLCVTGICRPAAPKPLGHNCDALWFWNAHFFLSDGVFSKYFCIWKDENKMSVPPPTSRWHRTFIYKQNVLHDGVWEQLLQDGYILHQWPLEKINTAALMMDTLLMDFIGRRHRISRSLWISSAFLWLLWWIAS